MVVVSLAYLIAVLDQLTKHLVRQSFFPGESLPILPDLFNLTYVRNTGAAWGLLGGLNGWLAVLSVAVLFLIVLFRRAFLTSALAHRLALGLMIGGICGNLIDRLKLAFVVDFLDFHWGLHHFPAFNVADAAICVGVGLYVVSSFWLSGNPPPTPRPDATRVPASADRPDAGPS